MQVELALCQRFLPAFSVATGGTCGTGVQGAASTFQMLVGFPVTTRVPPNSVVVSSGNAFTVITASTIICTGVTFTAASQSAAEIQLAVTGTAGQGGVVRATGAITYRFEGAEL